MVILLTMILQTIATPAVEVDSKKSSESNILSFEDTTPPNVKIEKPVKGVYFKDKKIFPRLIRLTLVIGSITIEVNATDNESGINRVEFYGGLRGTKFLGNDTTEPYSFLLKKNRIRLVHIQKIKVVAYDGAGN
ncbi:MAG: Ig-like domain-containing protein [Thermoplasmatota archaeon]